MVKLLTFPFILVVLLRFAQAGDFPVASIELTTQKQVHALRVELAEYAPARQYGLMHRQTVEPFAGMLFDFKASQPITMWMKNTLIPLDMVFFNNDQRVVHIHYNAEPESLELIRSPVPARYVLEVPAGDADRYGIRPGDQFCITHRESEGSTS